MVCMGFVDLKRLGRNWSWPILRVLSWLLSERTGLGLKQSSAKWILKAMSFGLPPSVKKAVGGIILK